MGWKDITDSIVGWLVDFYNQHIPPYLTENILKNPYNDAVAEEDDRTLTTIEVAQVPGMNIEGQPTGYETDTYTSYFSGNHDYPRLEEEHVDRAWNEAIRVCGGENNIQAVAVTTDQYTDSSLYAGLDAENVQIGTVLSPLTNTPTTVTADITCTQDR